MASVAKVIEILADSEVGFEDAIANGVARASKSLRGVTGAWVQDQQVVVKDGAITSYRVALKVTFVLNGDDDDEDDDD